MGECRLPWPHAAPWRRDVATGSGDHSGVMSSPAGPADESEPAKGHCMPRSHARCRIFPLATLVTLVLAGLAGPAFAQTYPTQNITFQVGFAAGGIADV